MPQQLPAHRSRAYEVRYVSVTPPCPTVLTSAADFGEHCINAHLLYLYLYCTLLSLGRHLLWDLLTKSTKARMDVGMHH